MEHGSLLAPVAVTEGREFFETLVETDAFRLERIVSNSHAASSQEWLEQECDEWVVVITGSAELLFEGTPPPMRLTAGDWVRIPARVRHKVLRTDPDRDTVWLALHYEA